MQDSIQYRAEGKIEYFRANASTPQFNRQFQISVSNAHWNIRITPSDVQGVSYYEIVHFGDSIYYYTAFSAVSPDSKFLNNGTAEIAHGSIPVERGIFASYVWLGLASSHYFRGVSNNEVQPIWAKTSSAEKVMARWQLFDDLPFLPKRVIYFNQASYLPPPFNSGWRAGDFQVTSKTNMSGLTMPMEFIFEYFTPATNAMTADDLVRAFTVKVSVQSVTAPVVANISPPGVQGPTLVEEQRLPAPLPKGYSVQYLFTKQNILPGAPEESAMNKYKILKNAPPPTQKASTSEVRIAFLVLLLISSCGILVLAVTRVKKQKNETQIKQ